MQVEMIYDKAPDQITIPVEFRGKSIRTIITDAPEKNAKKRTFAEALLEIPTDDTDEDLFTRDDVPWRGSPQGFEE